MVLFPVFPAYPKGLLWAGNLPGVLLSDYNFKVWVAYVYNIFLPQ